MIRREAAKDSTQNASLDHRQRRRIQYATKRPVRCNQSPNRAHRLEQSQEIVPLNPPRDVLRPAVVDRGYPGHPRSEYQFRHAVEEVDIIPCKHGVRADEAIPEVLATAQHEKVAGDCSKNHRDSEPDCGHGVGRPSRARGRLVRFGRGGGENPLRGGAAPRDPPSRRTARGRAPAGVRLTSIRLASTRLPVVLQRHHVVPGERAHRSGAQ
mmetsp:Transcript_463/g.1033  ORF Transcript_463/g.1033 Transcript_463/m.1033 type:complete len:211 (-) Transcript_463:77-709(-)